MNEAIETKLSMDEKRAKLAALMQEKGRAPKIAPLSFIQERLWFLEQLAPGSAGVVVRAAHIQGRFDLGALKRSLSEIVRRHEILRTTFPTAGGQPVQLIASPGALPVPVIDLSQLAAVARQAEIERLVYAEINGRMDLAQDRLFRANLLKLGDDYVLIFSVHHIIFDGWSLAILFSELATLYGAFSNGLASPLPELPIQYADFARWQRERLEGEGLQEQIAYWRQHLDGVPTALQLFTDRPRRPIQTLHGARLTLTFPETLSQALRALSQQEASTLFMTLLAAFNVLLYRYSGQDDICVGTVIANRPTLQLEKLIGFFLNHIALRVNLGGNPTFRELLGRVREVTMGGYTHQDLPFDKVLEMVRPDRDLSRAQLFQVFVSLSNMPTAKIELPDLTIEAIKLQDVDIHTESDLSISFSETSMGLRAAWEYNPDLFDADTIQRMLRHYENLLTAAAAAPDERIAALPLMSPQERRRLVVELNQTQAGYPAEKTIAELFAAQVENSPNAIAASCAGETLTYAQLNARANQVAHYLRGQGVGPDVLVGIALTRSLEMLVALLGVLKAGGAYLPLDPAYPPERLAFMLNDAQVRLVLTQEDVAPSLPAYDGSVLVWDGAERAAINLASTENPETIARPDRLAYVIYTSGSTGRPKGVMVSQRALVQYVTAARRAFAITPGDHVLQFASLSFDAAAEEIYPCLLGGAQLVLRTPEMLDSAAVFLQTCAAENVTVLDLPTAYWHLINTELGANDPSWPASVRLVILGGERARPEQVQAWQAQAPAHIRLVNTYGPTETTIVATMCDLTGERAPETAARAPIGKPVANTQVYVLDASLQPVPVGVPGELCIGGDDLAWGYLNQPELTAIKFIPDPFSGAAGARLYRSGDLVRYLYDDNLEFLGRVDRQVKIRGFRVELDELQSVLSNHPAVREAVVMAREDALGYNRLVAYVVPSQAQGLDLGELQNALRELLPDYMIPSALVRIDALPLTPSGKVNWRALEAYEIQPESSAEFVAPQDPLEESLAEILRQALKIESVGIYDNFFDLGGHSLLATRVIYQINQAFQVKLSVRDLFEEPTIAGLAMLIREILIDELETAED